MMLILLLLLPPATTLIATTAIAFATYFCRPSNTHIKFKRSDSYLDIDDSTIDNNVHDTSIVMLLGLPVAIPTIHFIQRLHVSMMIQHVTADNNNWSTLINF